MQDIRRILLPVDFSESADHAVAFAERSAKALDANVIVLHVDVLHPASDEFVQPEQSELDASPEVIHERLKLITDRLSEAGIRARGICRQSLAIAPKILEVADAEGADVIVAGTHGRRGMRRFLLGSETDELLRTTRLPIVLVPQDQERDPRDIRRILVPVDLSESSLAQVDAVTKLAGKLGAGAQLLHVIEPPPLPFRLSGIGTLSDLVPSLKRQVDVELASLVERLRNAGVSATADVEEGHAAREILAFIDRCDCDLVIIARHGHSRVERFLLGSITERVARSAHRPVLIIPGAIDEKRPD